MKPGTLKRVLTPPLLPTGIVVGFCVLAFGSEAGKSPASADNSVRVASVIAVLFSPLYYGVFAFMNFIDRQILTAKE